MNILIPHHWLLEHLDTKATPAQIQEHLSLCGPAVERIENIEAEPVYDIEVTTNRVDMMSVRGIAREAAAILPIAGVDAKLKPFIPAKITSQKPLDIKIVNDPELCRRIAAVKLENAKIGPAPAWMQKRLRQVGQRPLNNLVDITNYTMWEIGHPVHAFDYDRLVNKKVIVREAKRGQIVTTLDGKSHRLRGGEVVFDDGKGNIIDVPGIMGTANTVVTDKTKNILLLSESVDPMRIRQTSLSLNIRTQSAILNEKDVDQQLLSLVLQRGAELYRKITGAKVGSQLLDIYDVKANNQPVRVSWAKINTYANGQIPQAVAVRTLKRLGFKVTSDSVGIMATPPSWRVSDIALDVDLIEEIARLYGYFKFKSLLPTGEIPQTDPGQKFDIEDQIKQFLKYSGYTEVHTDPLVSAQMANAAGGVEKHLKLSNPLGEQWEYLRTSLIPTVINLIKDNEASAPISVFEMNEVFMPRPGKLPSEELRLAVATHQNYEVVKGQVEALLRELHISGQFVPGDFSYYEPGRSAKIMTDTQLLGSVGLVHQSMMEQFGLKLPLWIADVSIDTLKRFSTPMISLQDSMRFEPLIEDVTLILPPKTPVGPLIKAINSAGRNITNTRLVDMYHNSVTLRLTFGSRQRQLTQADVNQEKQKLLKSLKRDFGVGLRS